MLKKGLKLEPQLYDLSKDKGEQNNLAKENPELVKEYDRLPKEIKNKTKR